MQIKEKILNEGQRKMLAKLATQKIDNKIDETMNKEYKKIEELEKKLNEKIMKDPRVLKLKKEWETNYKRNDEIRKELNKLTVQTSSYGNTEGILNITLGSHPEIRKKNEERSEKKRKMEESKNEILADIYGLALAYSEMLITIERAIENSIK